MFPIKDDNPTETRPYITCMLIGLNILISYCIIKYILLSVVNFFDVK